VAERPFVDTPPTWSPTEVNTPSTQSNGVLSTGGSPAGEPLKSDIRPIQFTRGSASTGDVHATICSEVDLDAGPSQTCLAPKVEEKLFGALERKLQSLVDDKMPPFVAAALEKTMDKFLANVDDGYAQAQMELREEANDAIIDLHQARDDGTRDLDAIIQRGIDDLNEHVQAISHALEIVQSTTTELQNDLKTLLVQQRYLKHKQALRASRSSTRIRRNSF